MKIFIIILVALIVIVIAVYAYFGGFYTVKFRVEEQGGETFVYEKVKGDYRLSGEAMDRVYSVLLKDYGVSTTKGCGIYYDDPKKIEKSKLRSEAGCIIEDKELEKIKEIAGKFETKVIPVKRYLVTEFPYKNKMSVIFSLMKVYPAMNKYCKVNNLSGESPVMEIYDIPDCKIKYRIEL